MCQRKRNTGVIPDLVWNPETFIRADILRLPYSWGILLFRAYSPLDKHRHIYETILKDLMILILFLIFLQMESLCYF
jgi:hypothetical protein